MMFQMYIYTPTLASFIPGSAADFCQLNVDDEILSLGGTKVSDMDQSQWEATIINALETGHLVMDVRRYGKKGEFLLGLTA